MTTWMAVAAYCRVCVHCGMRHKMFGRKVICCVNDVCVCCFLSAHLWVELWGLHREYEFSYQKEHMDMTGINFHSNVTARIVCSYLCFQVYQDYLGFGLCIMIYARSWTFAHCRTLFSMRDIVYWRNIYKLSIKCYILFCLIYEHNVTVTCSSIGMDLSLSLNHD